MEIQSILEQYQIKLSIIELYHQNIKPCLGCEKCILQGKCVLHDDTEHVMRQLLEADGIILASPVYLQQVSGQLKTFFDRTCVWYHRPALTGKPILSIATTKGSGLNKTMSYLKSIAVQWGAVPAGTVGRSIFTQDKHISEKEVALFINLLDRQYWEEHHWRSQPYFYCCKINPIYRFISHQIGKILQHKMKAPENIT